MEKLLGNVRINTFRKKLFLTIIACTAVPVLFSMGNIIYTSLNVVKEQTIQSEEYNLELAKLTMSYEIDELIKTMNFIHFDDEIRSMLNASNRGSISPLAYATINAKLDDQTRNSNITIAIIPATGENYFSNYRFSGGFEFDRLSEWIEILESVPTFRVHGFSAVSIDDGRAEGHLLENNNQTILLGRRLTSYAGETSAYVFAGLEDLQSIEMNDQTYDRSLVLLDETGHILYDQDETNVGKEFQYYQRLKDTQSSMIISHEGNDILHVQQEMPFHDWTLVSYMPYDEAIDELSNAYTVNIYVITMALFVLIMILLFIVNRFTRPITQLADTAEEIEAGNLQIRSNIDRNDEIGRLSVAFDVMLDRIQDMFEKLKIEQKIKRKAEIAVLQGKIKPHFIFNILNTIRIQVYKNGDKETSQLILSFNKFLRMVYKGEEWISFEEELDHTRNYLHLMNSMNKTPIVLVLDIDTETLNTEVPRFFVQPIVENSLKHGFKSMSGKISILAKMEEKHMIVTISDDGKGMERADLERVLASLSVSKEGMIASYNEDDEQTGIGLKNINERMTLIYGEEFKMQVDSKRGEGMSVLFRIPLNY
ncbi:cache domain-containing sensor histidine kinase [Salipaludibacillus sp. HK11]|uniref:cache domain-containing sensor histidine kinase n=1 Tax=Salipaludibacillus sp. HK11 TaxID=3394320 RepID=UPI0039FD377C